jgi:UDP-N-acetyl-D-glucosamine/UDP-N-acetyl-D-galactosamine dehydrogenase
MKHLRRISVIGLGYVGLPVAVAFGCVGASVVAFDIDERRIAELTAGYDRTGEVEADALAQAALCFTADPKSLAGADFHIVAVPTPINDAKLPDLGPLLSATRTIGSQLKRGDIVVYESTVYPGAIERECVPILEALSGLAFGVDFGVGFSPERINPGDRKHRFENIVKVVSGSDSATLETVASVYASVVKAGIHCASSIAVAEAAKVLENTQRDLNIALMNEISIILHKLDIDTHDVLAAAGTKWNFLRFTPGLVGGHCIGVDPYYLTHCAQQVGHHPEVILAGRRINDSMGEHIARETVKLLMRKGRYADLRVTILGLTFKENVRDIRNTRVIDVARELEGFGIGVAIHDPHADSDACIHEYNLKLLSLEALPPADAVILAVAHNSFRQGGWPLITSLLKDGHGIVVDVRGILDRTTIPDGVQLWRL